jgi:hypothetical protein
MKKSITMRNNRKPSPTTSLTRKVLTLLSALLFLGLTAAFQTLQAQDEPTRITVEPDDFPLQIGALNQAIEQNGGDVIYVLKNGKTYFLEAAMEFDHFLHIEAEEYPSDNPPIIRPATNLLGSAPRISTYKNDILMRGIFFFAMDDMGGKQMSQRTSGEGVHLHYQHCYFMAGTNYFWWLGATGNTVRIEDSQIANAGRHTSVANQRFIDTRGNDTDSIIVINSSIYNINFHIVRSGGAMINHFYLDHVTVVNHHLSGFDLGITRDIIIKNSLFYQTALDGEWESAAVVGDAGPGYDGDRYYSTGGLIGIRPYEIHFEGVENSPTDADRTIIIKNNNFGGLPTQEYLDLWAEFSTDDPVNKPVAGRGSRPWGTDPAWRWANPTVTAESDPAAWAARDTIALVRIKREPMDSTLRAWAAADLAWATIENNIEENVVIADMPAQTPDFVKAVWYGTAVMPHYDYYDDIVADPITRYFHPGPGTPMATTGATGAWFRNLAYNEDTPSFRHAEKGYPVGSLVFFPELRAKWEAGEDLSTVSVNEAPARQHILAYPNPVRDALHLNQEADEVMIYNIVGKLVLNAQNVQSINVSELANGIYILSLVKNNHVSTQKIMVNK